MPNTGITLNGVGYNGADVNLIGRTGQPERIIPTQVWNDIVQDTKESSLVMANARHVRMTSKKGRQTLLASIPEAYWLTQGTEGEDPDTKLKPVTDMPTWTEQYIEAEEIATIVPIPDSIVDDADIPLWETVRPMLAESIALLIDKAVLFGVNPPQSWPSAIIPAAIAAGNVVQNGTGADIGVEIAQLGQKLARQKFQLSKFASEPGLQWELLQIRSANEHLPIYTQIAGTPNHGIYGRELNECTNGAWDSSVAKLAAIDWSKQFIGIRQDVTFKMFDEGVITDANGKVVLNLMQQDSKALRVTMRIGYQTSFPLITRLTGTSTRYPAAVLTPASVVGETGETGATGATGETGETGETGH